MNGKSGAGGVILRGSHEFAIILEKLKAATVYKAEQRAKQAAAELLLHNKINNCKINFWVDNQANYSQSGTQSLDK
jgi:hypothetical protein